MTEILRLPVWFLIALLLWAPGLHASTLEQQRGWFKQAHQALKKHDEAQLTRLKAQLKDYPLTPYLDIWQARQRLAHGDDAGIEKILAQYAKVPESIDLRKAWMKSMAERGLWPQLSVELQKHLWLGKKLPEIAMVAHWYQGNKKLAMQQFSKRWLRGYRQSNYSKVVHEDWLARGHPSNTERWNRIAKLARQGQWKQVKSLATSFSQHEKQWLRYWRSVQRQPEKALQQWPDAVATRQAEMMISDGIKRMSRQDPEAAWPVLQALKTQVKTVKSPFFNRLERHTALRAARKHLAVAETWLRALPAAYQNQDVRAWRTRLAILSGQWPHVLQLIASMPAVEQQQNRWTYWRARALEASGQKAAATPLYVGLAGHWGYYNFLSAEHLGQPFHFDQAEVTAPDALVAEIEQKIGVRRALEWLLMGSYSKARREWHRALDGSGKQVWRAATVLSARWGWHNERVRAAYRAGALDALPARFPMAFKLEVEQSAKETGLQAASIWSTMRQESLFNRQAVSPSGARGLMQLMPATAAQVHRQLKLGKGKPKLFSPALNIRLGATYLASMKQRFGNPALASAAYNAGPGRVSRWLKQTAFESADAWIEAIPFKETRRYVQRIMAFDTVYEWRQKIAPSSMIARMNGRVQKLSFNESALNQ